MQFMAAGILCGRWFQYQDLFKSVEIVQTELELVHLYENYLDVLTSSIAFYALHTVFQKTPIRLIFIFFILSEHIFFSITVLFFLVDTEMFCHVSSEVRC